jgi:hypothetical protein
MFFPDYSWLRILVAGEYSTDRGSQLPVSGSTRIRSKVGKIRQKACKPGSVRRAGRAPLGRWPFIWDARHRTPRATDPDSSVKTRLRPKPRTVPIWFCSRWGLPCHDRYRPRGALLPHPFTLTLPQTAQAVCFLWHFPWGRPRRVLPGTVFPWSPDFPPSPAKTGNSGHPAVWRGGV